MTVKIPLTNSDKFVLVDDEIPSEILEMNWRVHKGRYIFYAERDIKIGHLKYKTVKMHRLIMNAPDNMQVDHINMDGLDNRKSNLRLCTLSENIRNRPSPRTNKTGYKGISWKADHNKWYASIRYNKDIFLGYYDTPEDAAKAYDIAAKKYHGEFARLNFPE